MIDAPGIYSNIPEEEYHSGSNTTFESLSQSGAKLLLDCPATYRWAMDNPRPPKPEFDIGTATHTHLLDAGTQAVEVQATSWRAKKDQQTRDALYALGCTPLLTHQMQQVQAMAYSVREHAMAATLLDLPGESEVSFYDTDLETGLWLRGRADKLTDDYIIDVKTTAGSTSPAAFAKTVADYAYHMQAAWYVDLLTQLDGKQREFVFIVVSKTPPHTVDVYRLSEWDIDKGREKRDHALKIYRACLENNEWPGHTNPNRISTLTLPTWA